LVRASGSGIAGTGAANREHSGDIVEVSVVSVLEARGPV
jgi:hypothetical protein